MRRGRPSAVWRHLRATIPDRTGVLILDGTSFPEAGAALGRRRAAVLRRAGQDRQLPDRGDGRVVDGRPGVDAGRDVVPARGVADARAAHARPHSGARPRPAEVAAGAHVAAAGPRQRDHRDRGARRCGVRRERDAAAHLAPRAAAVRLGRLVDAHRVRRHAGPRRAGATRGHSGARARGRTLAARRVGARGARLGRGAARARVARRVVAQRHAARRGGPASVRRA